MPDYIPLTSPLLIRFTGPGYVPETSPLAPNFENPPEQEATLTGFLSEEWGDHTIFTDQYVTQTGWLDDAYGSHTVYLKTRWIDPDGFDAAEWGDANVFQDQFLLLAGFNPCEFPAPMIGTDRTFSGIGFGFDSNTFGAIRIQERHILNFDPPGYVPPTSPISVDFTSGEYDVTIYGLGWDNFEYGATVVTQGAAVPGPLQIAGPSGGIHDSYVGADTWISFYEREVHEFGETLTTFGANRIGDRIQRVYPLWFGGVGFGEHTTGTTRTYEPDGFDATQWGSALIEDRTRRAFPAGYIATQWGEIHIGPPPHLEQDGQDMFASGASRIYNTLQIVHQAPWLDEPEFYWGNALVLNRNQEVFPQSINPPYRQVRDPVIYNNARAITPEGWDGMQVGLHNTAYLNRTILTPGIDAQRTTHEHTYVDNARSVLTPAAFGNERFGTASLELTRRYLPPLIGFEATEWGDAFIAPYLRTLGVASLPTAGDEPHVDSVTFLVRTVTPAAFEDRGFSPPYFGSLGVQGFPPLMIEPDGFVVPARWGTSSIANRNREVEPFWMPAGYFESNFGAHMVSTRALGVQAWDATLFGSQRIEDSRQWVTPQGMLGWIGKHRVRFANEPPEDPAPNLILPIGVDATLFGTHSLVPNSAWLEGFDALQFGSASITDNTIYPIGMPPWLDEETGQQLGFPSLNSDILVFVSGIESTLVVPKVDMQYRTIWAVVEAPEQAVLNHPTTDLLHVVDGLTDKTSHHTISNFNRQLDPVGIPSRVLFGEAIVNNDPHLISPIGWKGRFGVPTIRDPNAAEAVPWDNQEFGDNAVAIIEEYGVLRPAGINSFVSDGNEIQLFNRTLPITGIASQFFGEHLIGPEPHAEPEGVDTAEWGEETFIDYRHRTRFLEGFDNFLSEYSFGNFEGRMRVWERLHVTPEGLWGEAFGYHVIEYKLPKTISPEGITSWPIQETHVIAHV